MSFIKEGHKIKPIEETMTIMHLENNYGKINTLDEIEILKAASSKHLLNEIGRASCRERV